MSKPVEQDCFIIFPCFFCTSNIHLLFFFYSSIVKGVKIKACDVTELFGTWMTNAMKAFSDRQVLYDIMLLSVWPTRLLRYTYHACLDKGQPRIQAMMEETGKEVLQSMPCSIKRRYTNGICLDTFHGR